MARIETHLPKTVKIPVPLIIHRPDISQGIFNILDAHILGHALADLQRCPDHLWKKNRIALSLDDERRLRDLLADQKKAGQKLSEYQILAAALYSLAFDRLASTYGQRQIVVGKDGAVDWCSLSPFNLNEWPEGYQMDLTQPFVCSPDLAVTAGGIAARASSDDILKCLALTIQAWGETPLDQPERRTDLRRGENLLQEALDKARMAEERKSSLNASVQLLEQANAAISEAARSDLPQPADDGLKPGGALDL